MFGGFSLDPHLEVPSSMELTPCIWKKRKLFLTNPFHFSSEKHVGPKQHTKTTHFFRGGSWARKNLELHFWLPPLPSLLPQIPTYPNHRIIPTRPGTWWNVDSKHYERQRYRPPVRTGQVSELWDFLDSQRKTPWNVNIFTLWSSMQSLKNTWVWSMTHLNPNV